jgi:hypothetical protein
VSGEDFDRHVDEALGLANGRVVTTFCACCGTDVHLSSGKAVKAHLVSHIESPTEAVDFALWDLEMEP